MPNIGSKDKRYEVVDSRSYLSQNDVGLTDSVPVQMNLAKRNSDAAKAWAEKRRVSKERALQQQRRRHQQHQQVARCASSSRLPLPSARRPTRYDEGRPPRHAAATSHEKNFAYMEDFRKSMADMYLELEGSGSSGDCADGRAYPSGSLGNRTMMHPRNDQRSVARREYQDCGRNRSERRTMLASLADEFKGGDASGISEAAGGWYTGPLDPAGQVLLCMRIGKVLHKQKSLFPNF